MYLRPANQPAHDRLWEAIAARLRARGIAAPDRLDHETNHIEGWRRPDLVLGQICNLPYRLAFRDRVTRIGAADYGLDGCAPGYYRSVFVVRREEADCTVPEFALRRFAYNDIHSQSGYGAPQVWAARHGFKFDEATSTGSHRASIAAVASGAADIAAIDAQTWRMALQDDAPTDGLAVIGATDPSPGMTFITAGNVDSAPYFAAISAAISGLSAADAQVLGLRGIVALPDSAYDLPLPPGYDVPFP